MVDKRTIYTKLWSDDKLKAANFADQQCIMPTELKRKYS